jgi:cold shock protein
MDVPPGSRDASGTVLDWYSIEGWGVLVSPEVAGTVFAHFSAVDRPGYRELAPGQPVSFRYTTPGQDGCAHSAWYVAAIDPSDGDAPERRG